MFFQTGIFQEALDIYIYILSIIFVESKITKYLRKVMSG